MSQLLKNDPGPGRAASSTAHVEDPGAPFWGEVDLHSTEAVPKKTGGVAQDIYCAISIDGDLRVGSREQQKAGVAAMRRIHADLGLFGATSWLINEYDFHWTTLHPEILMELAESGECIGLHDHQDTYFLENEPADRLYDFLALPKQQLKDFYMRNGRDIPLTVHRNGSAQQGRQIYEALGRLGYTILSDVRPEMKWCSRMIPVDDPIQHWKCLAENDPGTIFTDNSQIPLSALPWRHDAANWADVNSRSGHFLQAPITCLPWIDAERVQKAVNNSREQVFLVVDTHPYDLQDPETGALSAELTGKYHSLLTWLRNTYKTTFIRIDQIPGLISYRPENYSQETFYENRNRR